MQKLNLIVVFNKEKDKVLMCKRRKAPYQGLINFVGGKIEEKEQGIDAAYRELWEETAISKESIELYHLMDFTYYIKGFCMEVYFGSLKENVKVYGEENELIWVNAHECFSDTKRFAGDGNIEHIMNILKDYKEQTGDNYVS